MLLHSVTSCRYRPVEGQAKTVSQIVKGSTSDFPSKEIIRVPENKAEPSMQITIDDPRGSKQPVSKPLPSRKRGDRIDEPIKCLVYKDPFALTYKNIFSPQMAGIAWCQMIGDVDDYVKLVAIVKKKVPVLVLLFGFEQLTRSFSQKALEVPPSQFIVGAKKDGTDAGEDLDDDAQVCSCHVSDPSSKS